MKKNSTLAELLYIVSCYEKGRVKSSGIWSRKYVLSLKNSLNIMLLLIDLIALNKDVTVEEMSTIQNYIKQNVGTVFTESAGFIHMLKNESDTNVNSIGNGKLIALMRDIINETIKQLEGKEKNTK